MKESEYLQALHFNCLQNEGVINQSVPIVLAINDEEMVRIGSENSVALYFQCKLVAVMRDIEIFPHRKEERCCRQFGTTSPNHPYIKKIHEMGNWLIGGALEVLGKLNYTNKFLPNGNKKFFF